MAVGLDEFGVHGTPTPVAEDPGLFTDWEATGLQHPRGGSHLVELAHELREVGIGPLAGLLGENEVVADQFCMSSMV